MNSARADINYRRRSRMERETLHKRVEMDDRTRLRLGLGL